MSAETPHGQPVLPPTYFGIALMAAAAGYVFLQILEHTFSEDWQQFAGPVPGWI